MEINEFTHVAEEIGEFGTLFVLDQNGMRYLRFDSAANQTMMSIAEPASLYSIPLCYTLAPLLWQKSPPSNVLIAGVGGGDLIRFFKKYLPKICLTAIERDSLVIDLAIKYFQLGKEDSKLIIDDAYSTIKYLSQKNDIIIVDLHLLNGMPTFLEEETFYQHCFRNLSEEGVLCLNLLPKDKNHLIDIMKTVRKVFDRRCLYAAIPNHENITIYAFKHFPLIDRSFEEINDLSFTLSKTYGINFHSIWKEIKTLNPLLNKNAAHADRPKNRLQLSDILPK